MNEVVDSLKKNRYIIAAISAILILIFITDVCANRIIYSLYKNGLYMDPVMQRQRVIMEKNWAPHSRFYLNEGHVAIDFIKVNKCTTISRLSIKSTSLDEHQKRNIKNTMDVTSFDWGDGYVLNNRTADGDYIVINDGLNIMITAKNLKTIDEISGFELVENHKKTGIDNMVDGIISFMLDYSSEIKQ